MSAKSVKRGELTAGAARVLRDGWESKGWDILFDLGKAGTHLPGHVGEIVSWFGDEIKQERRLAYPDIAMVKRNQEDRVFALIEIEESSARP